MSATNPYLQRALRFCELCGQFMGNMSKAEWDRCGSVCRDCLQSRSDPVMVIRNAADQRWLSYTDS
jgi:NADH pyrophosphatase NudC (nudix superfamily)